MEHGSLSALMGKRATQAEPERGIETGVALGYPSSFEVLLKQNPNAGLKQLDAQGGEKLFDRHGLTCPCLILPAASCPAAYSCASALPRGYGQNQHWS